MHREIIIAILPFLGMIVASIAATALLVRFSGADLRLRHVTKLHGDQQGGVQSLGFVLTLPLFIMILMFIVQLTQITIGRVVVEYAAYAAARSASVWIPAHLGSGREEENQIASLQYVRDETDDNGRTYHVYVVQPNSPKFCKIHLAAAMACTPISPSRDVEASREHPVRSASNAMTEAYFAAAPSTVDNSRTPGRLQNKLAFALENTAVRIEVHHKEDEPPLQISYGIPPYLDEFTGNETGWQDQLVITVKHDFALLPGPGRLLARRADARPGTDVEESWGRGFRSEMDSVASRIERRRATYVYPLTATVRLSNEGEKSLLPYVQPWGRWQNSSDPSYADFYPPPDEFEGDVILEEHRFDRDEDSYWRRELYDEETGETRIEVGGGPPPSIEGRP